MRQARIGKRAARPVHSRDRVPGLAASPSGVKRYVTLFAVRLPWSSSGYTIEHCALFSGTKSSTGLSRSQARFDAANAAAAWYSPWIAA
ncbi:hypothetical protein DIE03_22435 [Burkholderia sp. Bp8992]|nr:hypothetical protein DIE03_22435 [Burkholderia sp. Bp8992]